MSQTSGAKDTFHVTSVAEGVAEPLSVEASLVRAELSKPQEQCEVLQNGSLQLVTSH